MILLLKEKRERNRKETRIDYFFKPPWKEVLETNRYYRIFASFVYITEIKNCYLCFGRKR